MHPPLDTRIKTEYTKHMYSFILPICEPGWHLLKLALLPEGKEGGILLITYHHSSQAAPQERAAVLGVASAYYLPWPLASSKPTSAAS